MHCKYIIAAIIASSAFSAYAATVTIPVNLTSANGIGKSIGTITATDTKYGLLLQPDLHDLPAGVHGFHIHEKPSCDDGGMAAGGHLDPHDTKKHHGPYIDTGHLGDSPALSIAEDGRATLPVLAPRLSVSAIKDHAIMIHAGGDTYSDNPAMGGGGARIACGVIK